MADESGFKIGDYAKVEGEGRVFRVCGFTDSRSSVIPNGWIIDEDGFPVNPKFCNLYVGATSVLLKSSKKL